MANRRPYRSSLREERAEQTRLKIREAARSLFVANGFTETTVADIAAAAGVAPQTIYSVFGTKGAIVAAILESIEDGAEMDRRAAEIFAASDARTQLSLFVTWICTLFETAAPVLQAALNAMGDPDVAAMTALGDERRLDGCRRLTAVWAKQGALRQPLDATSAAEQFWLLTGPENYLAATDGLKWSPAAYQEWLGTWLRRELLKPDHAD